MRANIAAALHAPLSDSTYADKRAYHDWMLAANGMPDASLRSAFHSFWCSSRIVASPEQLDVDEMGAGKPHDSDDGTS